MFRFKKLRRRGFTLPEVLVTVTVVAVLAAVVVPSVTQYVGRGNGPSTATDINQIGNGVTGYVADTHQYPQYLSDLVSNLRSVANWKGPYLNTTVTADSTTFGDDSASAFKSTGLAISFADSLINDGSYLYLTIAKPTVCSDLMSLDTTLDKADGKSSGRVQWTACTSSTDTVSNRDAKIKLMTTGG